MLTIQTYDKQITEYGRTVQQYELFSNFVQLEGGAWREGDRIYLMFSGRIRGGLDNPFRSTGLVRFVSANPDAPILTIMNSRTASQPDIGGDIGRGKVYIYEMDQAGVYKVAGRR